MKKTTFGKRQWNQSNERKRYGMTNKSDDGRFESEVVDIDKKQWLVHDNLTGITFLMDEEKEKKMIEAFRKVAKAVRERAEKMKEQ